MRLKGISSLYKEIEVKTANQGRLIVMLYDGAIHFLKLALEDLPKKRYDFFNRYILKSQDIINELILALDINSGSFAKKLYGLYIYMNKRLVEANIQKKSKPIYEIIGYLKELKVSWEKISHITTDNDSINKNLDNESSINIKF